MNLLIILFISLSITTGILARGRKPKLSYDDQWKCFRKYADRLQNPNIKYNDPIFSIISEELEHKMTPLALFLSLQRNRNTIFGNDIPSCDELRTTDSENDYSACSTPPSLSSSDEESLLFSFNLDMYDWKKIKPLTGYRKRSGTSAYRQYKTLPKYKWSSMLKEKIWIHSKLPCTWAFKKFKINDDKINLRGKCSQCSAEIFVINRKETDRIIKLICKVRNIDKQFIHNPKVKSKLTPYRRHQLANGMRCKPSVMLHSELASKFIDSDDCQNPPVLPSISALRKIKSDAKLELLPHVNPIISLLIMANTPNYFKNNTIRDICVFPDFRLCFWSDYQIKYYNEYYAKFQKVTITIDATGSFFEKVCLPDGTKVTKRLFLYVGLITANTKLKSVPIFQMVTDSHTQENILICLKKWLTFIDNYPDEIITDDSSALVSACIQAFALFFSTKSYISEIFSIFEGKSSKKPNAFIRLDTSHFIKSLHNLACFKRNIDSRIKYFYIRCLILLKHCENYETAKEIIRDMVKICLGPEMDSDYKEAKLRIDELLSKVEINYDDSKNENEDETYKFDDGSLSDDFSFFVWFDDILKAVKKKNQEKVFDKNSENIYYYPPFIPTLRRIILRLPLWSNLPCFYFNSENKAPSSSGIESYFKTLKHLVFKTKVQKYRIDEFLKLYSDFIDGIMKTARSDLGEDVVMKSKPLKSNTRKRKSSFNLAKKHNKVKSNIPTGYFNADSIFSDKPSFVENWRGEAQMDLAKTKCSNIKLLKNGNLCPSIYLNKYNVSLRNTCGFDSAMYILSAGFNENENLRDDMWTLNKDLIPQYIKCLYGHESTEDDILTMRAQIASQHFSPTNEKGNNVTYDCQCNISYIFEHILLRYVCSATLIKQCLNMNCQSNQIKRDVPFLPLNIDFIKMFGISILEEAICIDEENRHCLTCNDQLSFNYDLSKIVTFDLNGSDKNCLTNIPLTISIKDKTYKIIGAIEFIPALVTGGLGHYRSHSFTNEHFLCYDDQYFNIIESTSQEIYIHSLSYGLI